MVNHARVRALPACSRSGTFYPIEGRARHRIGGRAVEGQHIGSAVCSHVQLGQCVSRPLGIGAQPFIRLPAPERIAIDQM